MNHLDVPVTGTWKSRPALCSRAPTGWYGRKTAHAPASTDPAVDQEVCSPSRRRAWARLPSKIYEVDHMGSGCLRHYTARARSAAPSARRAADHLSRFRNRRRFLFRPSLIDGTDRSSQTKEAAQLIQHPKGIVIEIERTVDQGMGKLP